MNKYQWKNISEDKRSFYKEEFEHIIISQKITDIKKISISISGTLSNELVGILELRGGFFEVHCDENMTVCSFKLNKNSKTI